MVREIYQLVGCKVYNLAQGWRPGGPRHATTRQTKGLADLYVIPPRRDPFLALDGLPFWHEVKRPGGELRQEQVDFKARNEAAGIAVVVGGIEEARTHLESIGLWRTPKTT